MPTPIFSFRITPELKDAYKRAVHDGTLDANQVCLALKKQLENVVAKAYYTQKPAPPQPQATQPMPTDEVLTTPTLDDSDES